MGVQVQNISQGSYTYCVNRGVINKSMMLMLHRTVYDYEPIARVRWNK